MKSFLPCSIGALLAAGFLVSFSEVANADVLSYQNAVKADANAINLWSFDGATAGTRQADGKGSNNLNTFTVGTGNASLISYGVGFDASSNAVTPQWVNSSNGAAFITSAAINMPSTVSFEAIIAPGEMTSSFGYLFGGRATVTTRNYFLLQVGAPAGNQDLVNISGNDFNNQNLIVNNYTTDDWLYVAVTLSLSAGNTTVNAWAANLTLGETTLTHVVTNALEAGSFVNNVQYGLGILNDASGGSNSSLQPFNGKIDEIALYNTIKSESFFQGNLTTIVPEPSGAAMLLLGGVSLAQRRRRA